jgi:hyperosmotically inducible protein
MKDNLTRRILRIVAATLLAALCALGQDHIWAGRTLGSFEWTIHEKLAGLPSYGVFDTINFEVEGKTIKLSGQVVGEKVKHRAERAVRQINGVDNVVNNIEVLPSSRRDDALRLNMYRAIYQKEALEKASPRDLPIHIIVKDGWVTLEGVVDSDADRGMFHLRALQVTAHVSDNLRVVPDNRATSGRSGQ